MPDILHRIGATATPDKVYDALATIDGLAAWWTTDTKGDSTPGGTIRFEFGEIGWFDMKVIDQRPNERVEWEVAAGPDEWIGTRVSFDLKQEDDYTVVLFKQAGWQEASEFMHHCTTKWGTFLLSLKQLADTGTGAPHPEDVPISNWH